MMADDDTPDVDDPEVEDEEFDLNAEDEIAEEFEAVESVEALAESEDEDDDDVASPERAAKTKSDEDDDDDDDDDDDEIEADLGDILKDRIAAGDDDDEEDDEEELPKAAKPTADIAPKRADEWTCEQCFFIVSKNQFGSKAEPRCPQGEEPCPSMTRAFS